jgi:hypothetical protein
MDSFGQIFMLPIDACKALFGSMKIRRNQCLCLAAKWTDFVAKSADIVAKSAGLGRFSCCQLMPVKHSLATCKSAQINGHVWPQNGQIFSAKLLHFVVCAAY